MARNIFYKHKIENLIVIEKIVTLHYFEFTKDYDFAGESHDFWELVYADKEDIICSRGGEEFTVRQGGILFHKPDEFHTVRSNGITAPNVFVMSFVCKSSAMSFFDEKQFMLCSKLRNFIAAIMQEARQTFNIPAFNPHLKRLEVLLKPNLGGQQMIRTYLEQFLILLMRQQLEKSSSLEIFIDRDSFAGHVENLISSYLTENIYNKVTLTDICKKFNYGKTFVCTQFKKSTGQTIMQYYTRLKTDEAKKLIREKNLTFRQISELLGFDNPAHFTNTFKRLTNMTPTQYLGSIM